MNKANKKVYNFYSRLVRYVERILAAAVILVVLVVFVVNVMDFVAMDWHSLDVFYEVVRWVLALMLGLTLVRVLVSHRLNIVLELLALVIARKMLLPDITSFDIIVCAVAIVILMTARHFLFMDDKVVEKIEEKEGIEK